jgi:hypothetical protein
MGPEVKGVGRLRLAAPDGCTPQSYESFALENRRPCYSIPIEGYEGAQIVGARETPGTVISFI